MKKIYKLGVTLGATISIVAPLATVVACGGTKGAPTGGNGQPTIAPKTSLNLKDVQLTEYDVERNILNTAKNGILPVTRIQHTFEGEDKGPALIKIDGKEVDVFGEPITGTTKIETSNPQLQEHAKIFIDSAVQANGKSQSLDNPIASFTITKAEIMKNATAYQQVSDKVKNFIDNNSANGNKYSVLTFATEDDEKDANDSFSTGEYKINIYQKPKNSANLDKAINILKSNKFASDENALGKLSGFTFTPVTIEVNSEPNKSIYSNYIQGEGSDNLAIRKELHKNDQVPRIFDINSLKDLTSVGAASFTSTAAVNGSSSFQFASKNLTSDDMDFLDNNVSEVGNLAIDKKTNQIMIELTVTAVDDASLTAWMEKNDPQRWVDPNEEKQLNTNYEAGSVETIWIDLPTHTSWLKNDSTAAVDNKDLKAKIMSTIADSKFYDNLLQLCQGAETAMSEFWTLQGVVGPNLKALLLDGMVQLQDSSKYNNLLENENAFNDFITFASKNTGFDKNTLNHILNKFSTENPDGIPTDALSAAVFGSLNSSILYSTVAYSIIFYNELEKFTLSTEGQKYADLIKTLFTATVNANAVA